MKRRTFLQAGLALAGWRPSRTFDVLIVGAGAIGATTAYELRREGLSVALPDTMQQVCIVDGRGRVVHGVRVQVDRPLPSRTPGRQVDPRGG